MNKKQHASRKFIGIEMDKKYFEIAKERCIKGFLDKK